MKEVEFYYDYGSPASYLAWTQLPSTCERLGADLVRKPVLLGGIFKATGNATPLSLPPKGAWLRADLDRHAKLYGVPFERNPHFIFNTLPAMRGAHWARRQGQLEAYDKVLFEAAWANKLNIGDLASLAEPLREAGIDPEGLAEGVADPEIKQSLIQETEAAVARGLFGAPTMFVDGVMHFGQDRLSWIERALGEAA